MYVKTKFLPPTNFKGARLSATVLFAGTARALRTTIPYDHAASTFANHRTALLAAVSRFTLFRGTYVVCDHERGYIFTPNTWTTEVC